MDFCPCRSCDLGKADEQLQRVDMSGSGIADAVVIARRAHPFMGFLAIHEGDMRIAVAHRHDLGFMAIVRFPAPLVCDVHLAREIVDIDAMLVAKVEQIALGVLRHVEQRLGTLEAEFCFQFCRRGALPGAELAAIATGSPVTEAVALNEHDGDTEPGEIVGGLQPGEAAADNRDVSCYRAVEGRIFRPLAHACLIPGDPRRNRALPCHEIASLTR